MAESLSERSIVFKDRPNLRGLLRGIFEAKSAENGFGAGSRCVLGDGHTHTLPQSDGYLSHWIGERVCDGAHRWFVMKKSSTQLPGEPWAPLPKDLAVLAPAICEERKRKERAPSRIQMNVIGWADPPGKIRSRK
jgi:hypothetical protein